jgi:hypothetical protein
MINILLDLDQTLIAALSPDELDVKKYSTKMEKFKYYNMDGEYTIFERPHLQEFLDFLFDKTNNFNVSIWTAASKDYALFIINNIILPKDKPNRKLDFIFFSYHCSWSKSKKNGSKDLSMLWDIYKIPGYDAKNTIILDDYDEVKSTQPKNCIVATPFEFHDKNSIDDSFLKTIIPKLEKYRKKN